ncbi:MAG TPA: bifunctional (p)ppGpp synthetase/guanosine-3',5'-bis(diphosphate) 3'-pyrophosphohydrolase [Casimicrobiaceae bacterium]|jgi:GTP pyrophosphokinase|nr:bifunctional (p)ppGpp synthetase/guanosine-3',5'-bis(diphosphate) 3'-pyrophosphohydrolase [Casimicrobiaceae bacterium]
MAALTHADTAGSLATADAATFSAWLQQIGAAYSADEQASIAGALATARARYAGLRTADGEPWLERALGTAAIVAGLKLDGESVRAAVLLGIPALPAFDAAAFAEVFGPEVAQIVVGAARMDAIRAAADISAKDERAQQAENLRKMLLAMVEDIRVVLIKLAERTQALRFLVGSEDAAGEVRTRTARETLDLFAPLANRLGVWQLKWELEDLSLRALEPEAYQRITRLLDERRLDRHHYIDSVQATLRGELAAAGIKAEVSGRAKHIYSIWNKMRRKQAGIESLYDIRAVRILVDEVKDCYTALGVVHNLWSPVPREFDDYIAKPKPNDYQSLHTAVMGPEGKPLEVQIRTFAMHRQSEYGVAAHWRYKEGAHAGRRDPGYEEKIAWLRQVLDWKDAVADAGEWLQQFKSSLFTETIYVLTPQGKVVDLPRGATPVDFAYAVHTSLGHRCRGARVEGALVPLNHVLSSGQRVEIVAAKQGGPSRDWLNPELGYVHSHRARTKVRQWFKAQQVEETIAHGRASVERELARAGMTALKLEAVAAEAGYARIDEFFAAVARAEINQRALQAAIRAVGKPEAVPNPAAEPVVARESKAAGAGSGILIVGVDRLMTGLARCCKPAPPDPIVGFVTRGKGISIHRQICSNVARMRQREPERLITADWGAPRDEVFPVDVVVEAMDRQGLLRDISEVFSRDKINVTAVNTLSKNLQARMAFTLEVRGLVDLKRALALVREVPGVLSASRR